MSENQKDLTSIEDFSKGFDQETTPTSQEEAKSEVVQDFPETQEAQAQDIPGISETQNSETPSSETPINDISDPFADPVAADSSAPPTDPPTDPMEPVREYAKQTTAGKPAIAAAFPFSLRIDGQLTPYDRERLLSLLSREQMGISEMDLEPQFEAGKILIPRISEYAGVLIIQALRAASVEITLAPSATDAEDRITTDRPGANNQKIAISDELITTAERLPITPLATIPNQSGFVALDAVTASALLNSTAVETKSTVEYQEILDALQRELKFKAFHRGATAIINFTISLTPLASQSQYRITAMGSAVKGVIATAPTATAPTTTTATSLNELPDLATITRLINKPS